MPNDRAVRRDFARGLFAHAYDQARLGQRDDVSDLTLVEPADLAAIPVRLRDAVTTGARAIHALVADGEMGQAQLLVESAARTLADALPHSFSAPATPSPTELAALIPPA